MNTVLIGKNKKTKMIAHRGVSGIELENTISAFVAAGNRSYYGIETDVHRTLDGKFVVIHDDKTDRVSDIKMPIESSLYDDLRNVQLGINDKGTLRADRKIPNLKEYIEVCKTYEKYAILELKNHFGEEDVERIVKIIDDENYIENTVFISFDFENLVFIRKILPNASIQFLCKDFNDKMIEELKKYKMDVDIKYSALNGKVIKAFHKSGILVNCWTVNDKKTAEKLIKYNIDFITTNILE